MADLEAPLMMTDDVGTLAAAATLVMKAACMAAEARNVVADTPASITDARIWITRCHMRGTKDVR